MTINRFSLVVLLWAVMPAYDLHAQSVQEQTPDDAKDITRPTRLGIRMTPDMAKAFSRAYLRHGLHVDGDFGELQEQQLIDAMSRTLISISHQHAEQGRDFFEFTFEHLIRNQGSFDPDQAREYAKRATPLIPAMQEFLRKTDTDARGLLGDTQYEDFARTLKLKAEAYSQFEQKMQRWSQGQVEPDERPFLDPPPAEASATQAADDANRRQLRTAQRRAERELRRFGPAEWDRFLRQTESFFTFSQEQSRRAGELLSEARQEVAAVMTSKWHRKVILNRTKYHVLKSVEHPIAPYLHQLNREFDESTRPIGEIGKRFERAIFALASSEQQAVAVARLQDFALSHGMPVEPKLNALLTMPVAE